MRIVARVLGFTGCIVCGLAAVLLLSFGEVGVGILLLVFGTIFLPFIFGSKKPIGPTIKEKALEYNAEHYTSLQLTSGLPLAEHTNCTLFLTPDDLIIEAMEQQYTIPVDRILAAQTKGDTEIMREVTSSGGKALVGGLFFGPVGAIIGARSKTKRIIQVTCYLIINYINKDNETAVLAFSSGPYPSVSEKIARPLTERIKAERGGTVTAL